LGRSILNKVGQLNASPALRNISGRIATLGRQTIQATPIEIKEQFDRFGLQP